MNKATRLFTNIVLVSSLLLPLSVRAEIPAGTVDFLKSKPLDAWSVIALAVAGQSPDKGPLHNFNGQSPTDYEKEILALVAVGENPSAWDGRDVVQEFINRYYNGGQIGDPTYINDDFWGVLALTGARTIGRSGLDGVINDTANYIKGSQNIDGGWSFAKGGESDSNDTAAALMALAAVGLTNNDQAVQKAIVFLHSMIKSDCGVAFSQRFESDASSDAWVIIALSKLSLAAGSWTTNNASPVSHLQSLRNFDGSFNWQPGQNGGPGVAAQALVALSGNTYPFIPAKPVAPVVNVTPQPAPQTPIFTPTPTPSQPTTPVQSAPIALPPPMSWGPPSPTPFTQPPFVRIVPVEPTKPVVERLPIKKPVVKSKPGVKPKPIKAKK